MPPTLTYLLGTHPCASETFIQREIDALRRHGWTPDVVSLHGNSALCNACRCDRGPRTTAHPSMGRLTVATLRYALPLLPHLPRLPFQLLRLLPQTAALIQHLRNTRSTGIHAHFAHHPADLANIAARQTGLPFTSSVHAWDLFTQPPAATRHRLRHASAICACSQAAVDAVTASGIHAQHVQLIHHGLPLTEFSFTPDRPSNRILAVGRLEPKKGFDLLIAACAQLRDIPFTCEIIGAGSQQQHLTAQITANTVAATGGRGVFLRGAATPDETRTAMRSATLLVLPSRRLATGDHDGIANVLLEAMALGTPVITTTAGAASDVLHDNINGRLIPPDNPTALAHAIRNLLQDSTTCARLALAARKTIETQFDEKQTIQQLQKMLRQT